MYAILAIAFLGLVTWGVWNILGWIPALLLAWAIGASVHAAAVKERYNGVNPKLLAKRDAALKRRDESVTKRETTILEKEGKMSIREDRVKNAEIENAAIRKENRDLSKFRPLLKVEQEGEKLRKHAISIANGIANDAQARARTLVAEARTQASHVVEAARSKAYEIDQRTQEAENILKGTRSESHDLGIQVSIHSEMLAALKENLSQFPESSTPERGVIDDLAVAYGHTNPGAKLKEARAKTRELGKSGTCVLSDEADPNKASRLKAFALAAFNSKADAVFGKIKSKPLKDLKKEIKREFAEFNLNTSAYLNLRISSDYLDLRLNELKWAFLLQEHRAREQEEQKSIRQQEREEEKAIQERERAAKEAEKEEARLREALERATLERQAREAELEARLREQIALGETERQALMEEKERLMAEKAQELGAMQERLREAEERSRRELSMAQQTRAGHVYVISNRGSFGDGVYKIGMTRRLDPMDRVRELGDASVPFGFDVHAIIMCSDAPAMENALHKRFSVNRVNKVNLKKEFFRTSITEIKSVLDELGCEATWTLTSEAREYVESLEIDRIEANDPGFWERLKSGALVEASSEDEPEAELEDA